jgi:hypothetical protein
MHLAVNKHVHLRWNDIFQVFQTYVLNVLSGCCICCNDYIRILQAYVSYAFKHMFEVFHVDVAKIDLDVAYACMLQSVCFRCFHKDVASVSSRCCTSRFGCCIYLKWLHKCFKSLRFLQAFQLFRTYVASVSFKCCKSRLVSHMLQWDSLTTAACYSSWGATVGSPCRRLSPADASVTRIHRRGRWLEPTWFPTCGHDIQGGKQRGQRNRPPQVTRALRYVTREQTCSNAPIFFLLRVWSDGW